MSVNRNKKILRWKFLQFSNTKPAKHACKASYLTSPSSCLIEERWPSCRGKSLINFTLLSLSPVTFFSLWFPTMEHLNMFKTFPLKTRHTTRLPWSLFPAQLPPYFPQALHSQTEVVLTQCFYFFSLEYSTIGFLIPSPQAIGIFLLPGKLHS